MSEIWFLVDTLNFGRITKAFLKMGWELLMESLPQSLIPPAPSAPGHYYFFAWKPEHRLLKCTCLLEIQQRCMTFYNFKTNVKMGIVYLKRKEKKTRHSSVLRLFGNKEKRKEKQKMTQNFIALISANHLEKVFLHIFHMHCVQFFYLKTYIYWV